MNENCEMLICSFPDKKSQYSIYNTVKFIFYLLKIRIWWLFFQKQQMYLPFFKGKQKWDDRFLYSPFPWEFKMYAGDCHSSIRTFQSKIPFEEKTSSSWNMFFQGFKVRNLYWNGFDLTLPLQVVIASRSPEDLCRCPLMKGGASAWLHSPAGQLPGDRSAWGWQTEAAAAVLAPSCHLPCSLLTSGIPESEGRVARTTAHCPPAMEERGGVPGCKLAAGLGDQSICE